MAELLVWTRFVHNSAGTVDFVTRLEPNLPSQARSSNKFLVCIELKKKKNSCVNLWSHARVRGTFQVYNAASAVLTHTHMMARYARFYNFPVGLKKSDVMLATGPTDDVPM